MFSRRSDRSHKNSTRTIANYPHDWDVLVCLHRFKFYPADQDDRRLFQKSSLLFQFSGINSAWTPLNSKKNKYKKCSHHVWALFKTRESPRHKVLNVILCLRETLLASRRRKIERKSRQQGTRVALRFIPLCDPETSLATQRPLVFEAIETIIWTPPIVSVDRIVSSFLETTGAIGAVGTIIWKPGLSLRVFYCLPGSS